MAGRSLRPRDKAVDYTSSQNNSTPAWLKTKSQADTEKAEDEDLATDSTEQEGELKPKRRRLTKKEPRSQKPRARQPAAKKRPSAANVNAPGTASDINVEFQAIPIDEATDQEACAAKRIRPSVARAASNTDASQQPADKDAHSRDPSPEGPTESDALPKTFLELLTLYRSVVAKYTELKAQRMDAVEGTIKAIETREAALSQKGRQLAAHWEAEAQRQAAIAQHGDVAHLTAKITELESALAAAKTQLLDTEAEILARDQHIMELKLHLRQLVELCEQLQQAPAPVDVQQVTGPAETAQASPTEDASVPPATLTPLATTAELQPPKSDAKHATPVEPSPASRPLVPYKMGLSASQPAAISRFGLEAAEAQALADTCSQAAEVEFAGSPHAEAAALAAVPEADLVPAAEADNDSKEAQAVSPMLAGSGRAFSDDKHSDGRAMPMHDDMASQGMKFLTGLDSCPDDVVGSFIYCHAPTGFRFKIGEDAAESDDDFEGGFVYQPLSLGKAESILPDYLKDGLKFAPDMRLKLVGRILSHLSTTA